MVPPKIKNLLVAGRCVAGDKTSHAAMRNMMACTVWLILKCILYLGPSSSILFMKSFSRKNIL